MVKITKSIKRFFARYIIYFFIILTFFIRRDLLILLGRSLGLVGFELFKKERRTAVNNISLAFPELSEEQVSRIARQNFVHWGETLFETLCLFKAGDPGRYQKNIRVQNLHLLTEEFQKNSVIVVTPHIGNWEMVAAFLGQTVHPFYVLSAPLYDRLLENVLNSLRKRYGVRDIKISDLRGILEILKGKVVLGILPDHRISSNDIIIEFFGHPVLSPAGPAALSYKYNVPILPFYNYRDRFGRINIVFGKPFRIESRKDKKESIKILTEKWTKQFEEFIRRHPQQWIWLHDRWKI